MWLEIQFSASFATMTLPLSLATHNRWIKGGRPQLKPVPRQADRSSLLLLLLCLISRPRADPQQHQSCDWSSRIYCHFWNKQKLAIGPPATLAPVVRLLRPWDEEATQRSSASRASPSVLHPASSAAAINQSFLHIDNPCRSDSCVTMKDWRALSLAGGRLFLVYAPAKLNRENHRQSWRPPEDEPVMSTQAI